MGGRALKTVQTSRINRDSYDTISIEIKSILKKDFNRVKTPICYSNKLDFGDIDFIISLPVSIDIRAYIQLKFNPNEIFHNGNCWSFDYHNVQIDFIFVTEENFETTYMYMGYSDLGNLIGRLAHGFGLRYGQNGLVYEHYFKGTNIGTIPVSKDYPKIFEFLGLSYERWKQGFDELEDIFKFIAGSPYFNWKRFQLVELNKINRDRNKKRASYMSFLEWVDNNVADEAHEFEFSKDKSDYFDLINKTFPESNIVTQVRRLEYLECKKLYIQSKFNGGDVMRRYGFIGQELGDRLVGFKLYIKEQGHKYDEFIMDSDEFDIYQEFEKFLRQYEPEIREA